MIDYKKAYNEVKQNLKERIKTSQNAIKTLREYGETLGITSFSVSVLENKETLNLMRKIEREQK